MFNDKEPGAVQATRVADPGGEDPDPDPTLEIQSEFRFDCFLCNGSCKK